MRGYREGIGCLKSAFLANKIIETPFLGQKADD